MMKRRGGWREEKSGFDFLLFWRRLTHTQGRAEWLLRTHTVLSAAVGKWGMNTAERIGHS